MHRTYLSWYFFFFFIFSFLCLFFFLCEECPPLDHSIGAGGGANVSLETSGLTLDSPTTSELNLKRNFSGWEGGVSTGVTTGSRGIVSISRDPIGGTLSSARALLTFKMSTVNSHNTTKIFYI